MNPVSHQELLLMLIILSSVLLGLPYYLYSSYQLTCWASVNVWVLNPKYMMMNIYIYISSMYTFLLHFYTDNSRPEGCVLCSVNDGWNVLSPPPVLSLMIALISVTQSDRALGMHSTHSMWPPPTRNHLCRGSHRGWTHLTLKHGQTFLSVGAGIPAEC